MKMVYYKTRDDVRKRENKAFVAVRSFWGDISPEEIFIEMQAENWSPNGEKRHLIEERGASHTSMSIGDYVYDTGIDVYYKVEPVGFRVSLFDNYSKFIKGDLPLTNK